MIVAVVWGVAILVAVVVAGFCAYEVQWKVARLRADVAALDSTVAALADLQAKLQAASARASALSTSPASRRG